MENSRKKPLSSHGGAAADNERRRIARIVHDDRGNASVDWWDAPANYKRTVLEVAKEPGALAVQKAPTTFNPNERATVAEPKKTAGPKKDLKKLSEWIKLMRDLEERKRTDTEG
jgi:hypothetical protein